MFSRQHDARFRIVNATHTVISLLNNAADDKAQRSANVSVALVIMLDMAWMTARVERRYERPDGGLSKVTGNVQILSNRNVVVCWSEGGYITEFTEDGKVVLEARFLAREFVTYRAYKARWTGKPVDMPNLKVQMIRSEGKAKTLAWVSWNGATEVVRWVFYGGDTAGEEGEKETKEGRTTAAFKLLGSAHSSGFETAFVYDDFAEYVYAEAVGSDDRRLRRSIVQRTIASSVLESLSPDTTMGASEVLEGSTVVVSLVIVGSMLTVWSIMAGYEWLQRSTYMLISRHEM